MTQRNKTLFAVGFALFFAAWLAWKFLLTKAAVAPPPQPPVASGAAN